MSRMDGIAQRSRRSGRAAPMHPHRPDAPLVGSPRRGCRWTEDDTMGSHFRERLHDPSSRMLGMFVKFPTLETMEILASAGCDFVINDMEHAPLSVDTVYGMIVAAERSGMGALVRLRG